MRVFIAGATGFLGRPLVKRFRDRGDSVVGLARGPEGERTVAALGGGSFRADIFDIGALARRTVEKPYRDQKKQQAPTLRSRRSPWWFKKTL
ncbi:MAG: NAD-dependent epimerase/dehydratase family protein [candidate division KSB1 bacterium]|nr:NAD-dependent epimerase/dehydratase family protein [candidate division KSB1 bacterium]